MDWLTENKIPLGKWVKAAIDGLIDHAGPFFDGLSAVLELIINAILWLLQAPHPLILVAILALLAFVLRRSLSFSLFVALGLLFIINQGYWEETTETVALVLASTFVCMTFGVPIGIYAAHYPWFYKTIRPVLDLMQTIPTFVYLIPALILFGLGMVPGLIATVIFALPSSIRLTQLGIASTPVALKEAADAFGARPLQKLVKVELPHAMPSILTGLTQTIMLSLSMVVIAALVGADGLGVPTLRALNQVNIGKGFEVGLAIVLVAIMLDRFFRGPDTSVQNQNKGPSGMSFVRQIGKARLEKRK
jgi:glycine betaine/proline transport system permease protein